MATETESKTLLTLVGDYGWLLSFLGGARVGPVLLWAGTLLAGVARAGKRAAPGAATSAIVLLLGVTYWTFAEYALHRARVLWSRPSTTGLSLTGRRHVDQSPWAPYEKNGIGSRAPAGRVTYSAATPVT